MDLRMEIFIYILLAGFLSALRRIISGAKNGCFYAKNSDPLPSLLSKYIKNIHFLETPAWYSHFGFQFLLCFCIYRTFHVSEEVYGYILSFIAAMMTAMGSSAIAGTFYQGYINVSAGKEFIDLTENKKSEFALGSISFWWYRPMYGKRRIYASVIGLITLIAGIWIGVYYKMM
jgi:hypothetical protein